MQTNLFSPYNMGNIQINNRLIMAPLTRCRAINQNTPNDWMVTYYSQRASAGLMISEGSSPSPNGLGYANIPGLFTQAHVTAWKKVMESVHAKGGKMFFQMMHTGRIAHANNLPEGGTVVAPSAIAQQGQISTYDLGKQAYPIPEAMSTQAVKATIQEYVDSAKMAIEAGFDGVEIHSAHGYLPNQFINTASNQRTDEYGGSIENRCRFVLDIAHQMTAAIGPNRVGIRISPYSYADSGEALDSIAPTYEYLVTELEKLNMGYLHLSNMGEDTAEKTALWKRLRDLYKGTLILCGGFTKEKAIEAIESGKGDLIAFGRDYIGNPDLVERFENDYPLTPRNPKTWYTQNEVGYTDYAFYEEQ